MSHGDRSTNAFSRRGLLVAAGAAAAGAAGGRALGQERPEVPARLDEVRREAQVVSFHGTHQAGILTRPQQHLHLVALDLDLESAQELEQLLVRWTNASAALTAGRPVAAPDTEPSWQDSGDAVGYSAGRLTVTVGLGPGVFERDGDDRFGLRSRRPAGLARLPAFPGDALDPARSAGDLCLQICADDPQIAFHALRTLVRLAHGAARVRWTQTGFQRSPQDGGTPRNTLGFRDGSRNLDIRAPRDVTRHLWVQDGWMRNGTFLIVRRIRTLLDVWDASTPDEQERVIGRRKASGAPLHARHESDDVVPERLPERSHVREAAPESNGGRQLLRRAYNYADGLDPATGQLDAGLIFLSFQRSPDQFIAVQRRLAEHDALNKHISHTSSAVFAVPPGVQKGRSWAAALFGQQG